MIHMVTEPLNLVGINIRGRYLNRCGQIDDHFINRRGLNDLDHSVTDINRKVHFSASKALGAVFENPFCLGIFRGRSLYQLSAFNSDIGDARTI
ncbi:MAG: Uncharacterised protein [Halieaceae bacterium]|nr:MAG: Uncharacterised protein [Halieaceae bacterium]